jgi:hypothetical protein
MASGLDAGWRTDDGACEFHKPCERNACQTRGTVLIGFNVQTSRSATFWFAQLEALRQVIVASLHTTTSTMSGCRLLLLVALIPTILAAETTHSPDPEAHSAAEAHASHSNIQG